MSHTTRATPKSAKFSDIKQLKGTRLADSLPPADAADDPTGSFTSSQCHTALGEVRRQEAQAAHDADANAKVQRQRYVQLVMRMSENARQYNSLGLFVDAMLREILASRDKDVATAAAAATWALNLLATQGPGGAPLHTIAEALLPAIYCDYTPANLDRAPASVKAQLKDAATIRCNPYLTHTMYVEQVSADHTRVDDMVYSLERALQSNDARRHFVERVIDERRTTLMRQALCAWRGHARRTSALRRLVESQSNRHANAMAEQYLSTAFSRWKATLESSRNTFLTERLHEAAFQLENAKNQFQLQCYRADRLAQTAKETKEALQATQAQVDALKQRIEQLEEEKVQEARAYAMKLSQSVGAALSTVRQYRGALGVVADLQPPAEFYVTAEAQLIEEEAAQQRRDEQRLLREAVGALGGAGNSPDTSLTLPDETEEGGPPADLALLRWCNHVLSSGTSSPDKPVRVVRNFGSDFASGEVYLILLHHVFPEVASLAANQEPNTEYRLRRIIGMCGAAGLELILESDDFVYQREDRIFVSVSELFSREMLNRWKASSTKAAARLAVDQCAITGPGGLPGHSRMDLTVADGECDNDAGDGDNGLSDEAFAQFIAESQTFLAELQGQLAERSDYEKELVLWAEGIHRERAFLVRERRCCAPVAVVGSRGTRQFWSLTKNALDDLRESANGVQSQREVWKQLVEGPLRAVLVEKAAIAARFFYFYAGEGSSHLFEFDFWAFVETGCTARLREAVDKSRISDIFDRVVSPQLAAAVRAASVRAEMDALTLMSVARREMDVRRVGPAQFMEILVRIGVAAYASSFSVVDAVSHVFDELQLPVVANLSPVVATLLAADVRHITEYFSDSLVRIFFHYIRKQESAQAIRERNMAQQNGGRFGAVLAVSSLLGILQDANFLSGPGPASGVRTTVYAPEEDTLRRPFVSAGQVKAAIQELRSRYIGLQSDELVFPLFVEVISVLPHYWCPDPLVPFTRKYAAFLSTLVKQLIAFHSSSTLVLGNPPEVSLQGGRRVELSF